MDVLVSAAVLILFIRYEGKRIYMRHLWLPIAGTFAVGVSLGFPLFLYLREGAMEQTAPPTSDSAPAGAWPVGPGVLLVTTREGASMRSGRLKPAL